MNADHRRAVSRLSVRGTQAILVVSCRPHRDDIWDSLRAACAESKLCPHYRMPRILDSRQFGRFGLKPRHSGHQSLLDKISIAHLSERTRESERRYVPSTEKKCRTISVLATVFASGGVGRVILLWNGDPLWPPVHMAKALGVGSILVIRISRSSQSSEPGPVTATSFPVVD